MNKRKPTEREKQIAARIRAIREIRGLTLEATASRLGVTYQQYSRYELGENRIALQRLIDIAEALGKPIPWFFKVGPVNTTEERKAA